MDPPASLKPSGNFALTTDWPYGGTVLERLSKLYKTGGGTYDFVFLLEPPFILIDQRVYAHKAIVAAGSPVLKEIIEKQNKAGEWHANMDTEDYEDLDGKQFKWMIEFLYTDNVKDLEGDCSGELYEQLGKLLTVAKTFQVKPLETFCTNKLSISKKQNMSLYNSPLLPYAKITVDKSVSVVKKVVKPSEMKVEKTEETLPEGRTGNNFKSNIVKEVVSELKQKLVSELEKDLMAEIKQEMTKSDLKSNIMEDLAKEVKDKLRLDKELEMALQTEELQVLDNHMKFVWG